MPAKSKKQQRLMGMAYAAKKGELSSSKISPEIQKIMDSMSKKQIRDFAKTKTSDLPEQKKEASALSNMSDKLKIILEKNGINKIKGGNIRALNLKQFKLNKKANITTPTYNQFQDYEPISDPNSLRTGVNFRNRNILRRTQLHNMMSNTHPGKDITKVHTSDVLAPRVPTTNDLTRYDSRDPDSVVDQSIEADARAKAEQAARDKDTKELLSRLGITGLGGAAGYGLTSMLTDNRLLRGAGLIGGGVGGYYLSDPSRLQKIQELFGSVMDSAKSKWQQLFSK